MKKISPMLLALVFVLVSILSLGTITINDTIGPPGALGPDPDPTGPGT